MRLVIVESPSKAKTIGKYLGKEYKVIGSGGHVRDLPEKSLGIDVRRNFKPFYVLKDKMKKNITILRQEVEKAEMVYLATDPDREGEAISWHLAESLNIKETNARIVFNEISSKAVKEAINNPRDINMNLVNAQQARRVLDRLVGYMVSPVISNKIRSGLSAGRVQSAALRMIVDREKEIKSFIPEEYWHLFGFFSKISNKCSCKAEFSEINNKKVKLTNKDQVEGILNAVRAIKVWNVDNVKRGTQYNYPKPPFTTSTMQQDAVQKLNLSATQIMSAAQKLYEGVDIDGEHIALVTYIRTDSVRISNDALYETRDYIVSKYGSNNLPVKPNYYKNKDSAQDAHEAIRPISINITPDSLEDKLDRTLLKLYRLIYDRFVACQMKPAEYDTLNVRISGENTNIYSFKLQGKTLKFKGHLAAYESISDSDEGESAVLSNYIEGEKLNADKFTSEQKFTQPPSRFTESTLVKAMEDNGIGRPSTYATVISTLTKRMYVEKEKKFMKPTETGELVCDVMSKFFPEIIDLKFTAKMESDLDSIDTGREWQEILRDFYPKLNDSINNAYGDKTRYKLSVEESDKVCNKCGKMMLIRTGKYGKFYACSGYPECKNILPYDEPVAKCPKCGNDVYKKKSKKGKTFYGCSDYPRCDYVSWDIPAPIKCPDCGSSMTIHGGKSNTRYECSDKNCGKKVIPDKND